MRKVCANNLRIWECQQSNLVNVPSITTHRIQNGTEAIFRGKITIIHVKTSMK